MHGEENKIWTFVYKNVLAKVDLSKEKQAPARKQKPQFRGSE